MQNFVYQNPTKVIFGKGTITQLPSEVKQYGDCVLLVYSGKSVIRNGILDSIKNVLTENDITFFELKDVRATLDDVYRGIDLCKKNGVDVVLAIGGGAAIDTAKSVGLGSANEDDIWDYLTRKIDYSTYPSLPVGAIVTFAASGSEVDSQSEIDNLELNQHGALGGSLNTYPKFAILDPVYTYGISKKVTAYNGACTISQILEQYVNPTEATPIQDGFMETILRTCVDSLRVLMDDPENYDARANMMWSSALACNRILGRGKATTWQVGGLCDIISKYKNIPYTTSIAIVLPKYLYVHSYDQTRILKQFAVNVFNVDTDQKTDEEIAKEGANCLQEFFNSIGIETTYSELGIHVSLDEIENQMITYAKRTNQKYEDVREMMRLSL